MIRRAKSGWVIGALVAASSSMGSAQTTINDLILWDYRDGSPIRAEVPDSVTLPIYHQWLLGYLHANTPPRLILYVSDPCAPDTTGEKGWLDFYNPTSGATDDSGALTFVGFLTQAKAIVDDIEISIDSASFASSGAIPTDPANACWGGSPSGGSMEPTWLPAAFDRLPNAMGWLEALMANTTLQSANPVTSFNFDPEGAGGTPFYVNLMLWMDKYMATIASPAVASLDVSMTFGFEAHTVTKVAVAELPSPPADPSPWPVSLWTTANANADMAPYTSKLAANSGFLPWRMTADPLLDRAYLQVYSACVATPTPGQATSEFWRWIADSSTCGCSETGSYTVRSPADIATSLVNVMHRAPDACGQGTIEATVSGDQVTLQGTGSFIPFMEGYSRLQLDAGGGATIPSAGEWKYMADDPPAIDQMDVSGPAEDSGGSSLPYRFTEISLDFRAPEMTDASPDRIILMFSAEKSGLLPFFGWGTPDEFYQFIDAFITATQATDDASTVYVGASGPLPVPANRCAIYDLKQICDNWSISNYGSTGCAGDATQDGAVNTADLLHVVNFWGTDQGSADLNGDGQVGIHDLLHVVHAWGACSP